MSKPGHRSGHKRTKAHGTPPSGPPDGAVYAGLVMIGVFALGLWYLASSDTWKQGVVGYVIALAVLTNLAAWRACWGRPLSVWQGSLARLVLRCAGFGTKKGRPVEAAHGSVRARSMFFLSIATSVVVVLLLSWWLFPR